MFKKVITAELKTDNLLDTQSKEEAAKLLKKKAEKSEVKDKKEPKDDKETESKSSN